jgi:hypothetical protein
MQTTPYFVCLWPGLPRLWWRGDWSALALAVAFGVGLNLLLAASFVYPELLPAQGTTAGWTVLGLVWLVSAALAYRSLPDLRDPPTVDDRGLFIQAQAEYLKGHWFEAETLLRRILRHCSRDADALLMLATLYRRTKRWDEARRQLDRLERLDGSRKWRLEIAQERERLRKSTAGKNGTESGKENNAASDSRASLT